MQHHPLLDPQGSNKTMQITNGIRRAIESQQLPVGQKLPSIRQMARQCDMSPFTVSEAYDQLVQSGWLYAKPASGYYVARRAPAVSRMPARAAVLPPDTDWLLTGIYGQEQLGILAGCGWLPENWYEQSTISRLLRKTAREQEVSLRYGHPKGLTALREFVSEQLAQQGIGADAENIITTQGATHALELLCRVLRVAGQPVLVDDPGYCNLLSSLSYRECQVHGVPWTPEGPNLEELEQLMARCRPRVFFTNPWQQNPTGASYSPRVAYGVLQLAEKYDVMIVEDNVAADLLDTSGQTLAALDGLNRVFYVSSYSKSLSPSLRVGYIATPPRWAESIMRVKMLHGLSTPTLNEQLVLSLCKDGKWKRHNQRLKHKIQEATASAISRLEKMGWEVFCPEGKGMFIWARQPENIESLIEEAYKQDIQLTRGNLFRPSGQETPWLRFNSAHLDAEKFWKFIARYSQK